MVGIEFGLIRLNKKTLAYASVLRRANPSSKIWTNRCADLGARVAVNFQPLAPSQMESLRDQCRLAAADGHLELFKMTTKYDGKVGREQHHFPTVQQLPL